MGESDDLRGDEKDFEMMREVVEVIMDNKKTKHTVLRHGEEILFKFWVIDSTIQH